MASLKLKSTPKITKNSKKGLTKKNNSNQKTSSKSQSEKQLLQKFLKEVKSIQEQVDNIAQKKSNKSLKRGKKCTLKVNVNKMSSNIQDEKLKNFLKSENCYLNYKSDSMNVSKKLKKGKNSNNNQQSMFSESQISQDDSENTQSELISNKNYSFNSYDYEQDALDNFKDENEDQNTKDELSLSDESHYLMDCTHEVINKFFPQEKKLKIEYSEEFLQLQACLKDLESKQKYRSFEEYIRFQETINDVVTLN